MSSSSNSSFSAEIADIKRNKIIYSQVWCFGYFIFGTIGHTLNIYIFTRPKFRSNPCVRYFLASTLFGYEVVLIDIPLRMLQSCYNINVFAYSIEMCKFLSYTTSCCRILPSWFVALASVDRYLCSSSSPTIRRWSNVRVASRVIPFTVLFIAVAYIHLLLYQTLLLPQRVCTAVTNTYQSFSGLWNLIFWSWIPSICMLIFGLLIIRHIHKGKRRIIPQNQSQLQQNQKKIDRQLIQMLLIQSFILGSTTTVVSIQSVYVSITNIFIIKNDLDQVKDNYISTIVNYIGNISACLSFYIFTLSSQLFRRELINLFYRQEQPIQIVYNTKTGGLQQLTK